MSHYPFGAMGVFGLSTEAEGVATRYWHPVQYFKPYQAAPASAAPAAPVINSLRKLNFLGAVAGGITSLAGVLCVPGSKSLAASATGIGRSASNTVEWRVMTNAPRGLGGASGELGNLIFSKVEPT